MSVTDELLAAHTSDDAHASDDAPASHDGHTSEDAHTSNDAVARVGVFYGEPTPRHHAGEPGVNRTEAVAKLIAAEAGVEATFFEKPYDSYDWAAYDAIIVGSPTYNTGDSHYRSSTDWDDWLYCNLPQVDFSDKNVAVFGSGVGWVGSNKDGSLHGYGDNFGDAMGELYDRFAEAGARMFGSTPENHDFENGGYNFTKSKFVRNGMFMGQIFDNKEQEELSPGRAKYWVRQLRDEGFFKPSGNPPLGYGFNEGKRPYPDFCEDVRK